MYVERYREGERREVWSELMAVGEKVREEPVFSDALAVARETMERARSNVDTIVARLTGIGCRFGCVRGGSRIRGYVGPHIPPPPDSASRIAVLTEKVGTLPLSLEAWWNIVGAVDLRADHPYWAHEQDALVVYPVEAMFELADCFYEEWRELHELGAAGYEGRYELTISCDRFHKDGVSGGESYGIPVPHPGADAPLLWEWHNTTFVDYLRICFEWGGFPGLARRQDSVPRELLALSEGLLPI